MTAPARRGGGATRHVYDAVVLGADVGGALCAALLARRGLKVLCLDVEGASSWYERGDWLWPRQPFVLPPAKALPAFEAALEELNLTTAVHRALRPLAPGLQLLRPGHWVTLYGDAERRRRELLRALGPGGERFGAALAEAVAAADAGEALLALRPALPPDGFFSRWKAERLLRRVPGHDTDTPLKAPGEPLQALVCGLEALLGFSDDAGPLGRARLLGKALAGPSAYPLGREGLAAALLDRVQELGSDVVREHGSLEALVFEGRRPVGLRLVRSEVLYRTSWTVVACDAETAAPFFPEGRKAALAKRAAAVAPARALLVHSAVVPERALPRGLGEFALVEAPAGGPPVAVQVLPARRVGGDAPDHRTVCAAVPVSAELRAQGEGGIRAAVENLWQALAPVMPFTRSLAVAESTAWLHAPLGAEPHPLFRAPPDALLPSLGVSSAGPYSRLGTAGRQVWPGLGLEGEALAALRAAADAELALRKKDSTAAPRPAA